MSGSDLCKDALVAQFPGTSEKDWKRTSKRKDGEIVVRTFKNTKTGAEATVYEENGSFSVDGLPLVAKITEAAQEILDDRLTANLHDIDPSAVEDEIVSDEISQGSFVTVPAGTLIFEVYDRSSIYRKSATNDYCDSPVAQLRSKRETTVEVLDVFEIEGSAHHNLMTPEIRRNFEKPPLIRGFPDSEVDWDNPDLVPAIRDQLGDTKLVVWSGNKGALLKDVRPAAPKQKTIVEKPVSKKALMTKGSKWRVTQDVSVHCWVTNAAFWDHVNRNPYPGGHPKRVEWNKQVPEIVYVKVADLKAGSVFTVADKMMQDFVSSKVGFEKKEVRTVKEGEPLAPTNGLSVPLHFEDRGTNEFLSPSQKTHFGVSQFDIGKYVNDGAKGVFIALPYKALEPFIEPEGELTEQYIYLIRDRVTGLFYKTPNHDYFKFEDNAEWLDWLARREGLPPGTDFLKWSESNPPPEVSGAFVATDAEPFNMVNKISRAKQHKDLSRVKMTILQFSGYYDGLGDQQGDAPEWALGDSSGDYGRPFPFPASFECVKVHKFTKEEVEVIDLQQWFRNTWRLRGLTLAFGSSVRGVYKKLEKANRLNELAYVVTFRPNTNTPKLTPTQVSDIEEILASYGPRKVVREKDPQGISVAVSSLGDATALKLAYSEGQVHVVDLKEMQEVITG